MSHNKGSALPKPPFPTKRLDSRVLRGYCGAQVIYGPGPFTREESKGPSRGGLWSKLNNITHKIALGYSRGSLSPRQTQSLTRKRGKNGIRLNLKENLKYQGKAALNAIQYSAPDRAAFIGFYNYLQRLWVWTDGTSISFGKFKPTRGRRIVDAGWYKRKSK